MRMSAVAYRADNAAVSRMADLVFPAAATDLLQRHGPAIYPTGVNSMLISVSPRRMNVGS